MFLWNGIYILFSISISLKLNYMKKKSIMTYCKHDDITYYQRSQNEVFDLIYY